MNFLYVPVLHQLRSQIKVFGVEPIFYYNNNNMVPPTPSNDFNKDPLLSTVPSVIYLCMLMLLAWTFLFLSATLDHNHK